MMTEPLFFERDVNTVAKALLGMLLIHETPAGLASGMIVETEAYSGINDAACHAYPYKKTPRTAILFAEGGRAYVYQIYGMYYCFNVTANQAGCPEAVLIRALAPAEGISLMQERRNTTKQDKLCGGPGRLCQALAIDHRHYGMSLRDGPLRIAAHRTFSADEISSSPRINIDYAGEAKAYPWRYFVKGCPYVSRKNG